MKEEKEIILKVENLSKQYRLGLVGTGTISHDLNRWWYKIRGKEDPYLKIGDSNDRSTKGNSSYVWALKDVNFDVKRGEVLGIIGKNGAGKSTLLKILSRVTSPSTGSIKSRGRIASLLEVGTGFHPELTGRENIYLNGAILGMTKKEIASKIDEIIEFSGCERYVDTPVKRYSSGMTVRLAFAVAAHLEPDILIVDEVLAVGDAEFQKKAIGKMQDISSEQGRTVLFVSHNMAAVQSLCSRGILLEDGKVVFEGNVNDSIELYINNNLVRDFKFKNFSNRLGKGNFRITDIHIFNDKNITTSFSQFKSGCNYYFSIEIENFSEQMDRVRVGLSISSSTGQILTATGSEYFIDDFPIPAFKKKKVHLYIPAFPFTAGSYVLNISCNSRSNGLEDFVKDSLSFDVEGITPRNHVTQFPREIINIKHNWFVEK